MPYDINTLVIDRALRGIMMNPNTGAAIWDIDQIEEPSLSVSADKSDAVDATGAPIMSFYRAKTMQFTGSNSLLSLRLLAAQSGRSVEKASTSAPIITPIIDDITADAADTLTLTRTPYVPDGETHGVPFIYRQNGDGGIGEVFQAAETAAQGKFTISGKVVTFNTGAVKPGDSFVAIYEYEADGATGNGANSVKSTAIDFPTAGKFLLEVLCYDPCDPVTKIFAYLVMPNAKLTADFELGLATDSKHPFTIDANQNYCDKEKVLFNFFVPEGGIAA